MVPTSVGHIPQAQHGSKNLREDNRLQHEFSIQLKPNAKPYISSTYQMDQKRTTSAVESESRSRKDFQPEELESQKILTTPTPGRPFAHQL